MILLPHVRRCAALSLGMALLVLAVGCAPKGEAERPPMDELTPAPQVVLGPELPSTESASGAEAAKTALPTDLPPALPTDVPTSTSLRQATDLPQASPVAPSPAPPTVAQPITAAQPTRSNPGPRRPPEVGAEALDFRLPTLEGGQASLSDFRGKKVMLNFWASWCGPCRSEIPHMVRLYDELEGQDFEIVAVNLREDPERVGRFVDEFGMDFPILLDRDGKIGGAYFVRGIPTSVFVDEDGTIVAVHRGTLSDEILRNYVDQLMAS